MADVIVEFTQDSFTGSEDSQSVNVSLQLAAGSAQVPPGGLTVILSLNPSSASCECVYLYVSWTCDGFTTLLYSG